MKKATFEIEKSNGETFFAFEITVHENGQIKISNTKNCSLADIDGDYIFNTNNELFRIQEN